jgi:ABC-type glycerol-3-phosphate transport system substrate-binding protein
LFENVYLQTAGLLNYDRLSRHEILWTDPSVRTALLVLRQLFSQSRLIAGGRAGALQTEFPDSVVRVFSDPPKAAMVYEADFVVTPIRSNTKAKVGREAKFFPFPAIGPARPAVVAGGDAAVAMKDDKATWELMKFLASPESGIEWAKLGGFVSPNKDVPLDSYTDGAIRRIAQLLLDAGDNFRFGMSDLAPTEFGATKGAGEWKDLQDFLADPDNLDATMQRLEADAMKVYGK